MPRIIKNRRPAYRKKKYIRRPKMKLNRMVNRGTLVYKGQPGIADRALIKLKYRDNYTLTVAAPGVFAQRCWRLNSIYDPDFTGLGHQPLCYDQWQVFYKNYRVYRTDVVLSITNQEIEGTQLGFVVQPDDSSVTADDSSFEQPHTYTKIVAGSQGQNRTVIKRSIHHPRIIGQTSVQYRSNENTYAAFGVNPNTNVFGILMASTLDGSSVPNLAVNVQMVFHVELFGRKEQALSNTNGAVSRE